LDIEECLSDSYSRLENSESQNTTQKAISIVFCVSSIRHDSSLSKDPKQK
jgi:hypothetical protein